MIVTVDASVAAMWFLPEPHSDKAALFLGPDYELVAPDLLRIEVGSALLKALRRKEITDADGAEALRALLPAAVRLIPSTHHADAAFEIARRHGGSLYEAVYISVAHTLDTPVVTNDTALAKVARKAKVRALMVADGPPSPAR